MGSVVPGSLQSPSSSLLHCWDNGSWSSKTSLREFEGERSGISGSWGTGRKTDGVKIKNIFLIFILKPYT